MLNPIFSKKVQGQKHPGRWGIVEHQIPSIKVLFKTNTKGHKHPSIRLLLKSKTQLVNHRKQKVAFSPGTTRSPEIQSYKTWWGAASPILNDTPVVYTSYKILYECDFLICHAMETILALSVGPKWSEFIHSLHLQRLNESHLGIICIYDEMVCNNDHHCILQEVFSSLFRVWNMAGIYCIWLGICPKAKIL